MCFFFRLKISRLNDQSEIPESFKDAVRDFTQLTFSPLHK